MARPLQELAPGARRQKTRLWARLSVSPARARSSVASRSCVQAPAQGHFVHGCFWHRHPNCVLARMPKSRLEFWGPKLEGNRERDDRNTKSSRGRAEGADHLGVSYNAERLKKDNQEISRCGALNFSRARAWNGHWHGQRRVSPRRSHRVERRRLRNVPRESAPPCAACRGMAAARDRRASVRLRNSARRGDCRLRGPAVPAIFVGRQAQGPHGRARHVS